MIRSFQKAENVQTDVFPSRRGFVRRHVRLDSCPRNGFVLVRRLARRDGFVRCETAFWLHPVAPGCARLHASARGDGTMGSFSSCDEPLSGGWTNLHWRFAPAPRVWLRSARLTV